MSSLQVRDEIRSAMQDILQFVIEEIEDDIEIEASRLKRKRKWVNDRTKRETCSYLPPELTAARRPTAHFGSIQITEESFNWLLQKVEPYIQKNDTVMRMALPAILKLEVILYLLTTGQSLRVLEILFEVSKTSICLMLPAVCDAISTVLQDYVKVPSSEDEWRSIENGFKEKLSFPGCCGAIDGRYFVMKSQSDTENSDQQNSISLLAVSDDDYCFKYIDISYGRPTENGFHYSNINNALDNNLLPDNLFIVGDGKFPFKSSLMTPYKGSSLSDKQKIFNYRLSLARRVIENAFGIFVDRFKIFEEPLAFNAEKTEKVVKACLSLHNWIRMTKSSELVTALEQEDQCTGEIIPGSWTKFPIEGVTEYQNTPQDCYPDDASDIRDKCADYFVGKGRIEMQWWSKDRF